MTVRVGKSNKKPKFQPLQLAKASNHRGYDSMNEVLHCLGPHVELRVNPVRSRTILFSHINRPRGDPRPFDPIRFRAATRAERRDEFNNMSAGGTFKPSLAGRRESLLQLKGLLSFRSLTNEHVAYNR
jgi:hypothetical protein